MDVYEILMQDHRTVEQIFIEIEQTDDREMERREQLFRKLWAALEDHTVVEENLFYPEIEKYPAIKEVIAEAFDEHAEFEQTLQQISELPTDKADWLEMIKELKEVVQEHVRKEEDKMFPAARKELDESRAEGLGREILEMKQEKSSDGAPASARTMMKALVYQAPGKKQLEERPVPQIEAPTDAVVKIVKTTICGTDLHILKGDVPSCSPGRILGHEGVGVVEKTGAGVTTFHEGDRVLARAFLPAVGAPIAGEVCIRTARRAGGSSGTGLTAHRLSTCGFGTPTQAFIRFPPGSMKRLW